MRTSFIPIIAAAFLLHALPAAGGDKGQCIADDSGKITLEDIFSENKYAAKGITALKWDNEDKAYYTLVRNPETGANDVVSNDIRTGRTKTVISSALLVPEGRTMPINIEDYAWSDDGKLLLIYTNSKKVWRLNSKGDYWIYDTSTSSLRQVGQGLDSSELMFAKFSPDGANVAYVYRNNIYCENVLTGERSRLTFDGDETVINGNFDWVYEEELHIADGFRWSPDGTMIAYWQSDTEGTGVFYMIDNIDSVYSTVIPLPYPKAGTANSAVRAGVVKIGEKNPETKWFDIPGDPRNNYIARMDFLPGSNTVMLQQLNRLQNTNKVYLIDCETLEAANIMTETDEAFLDIHDNTVWAEDGGSFTWTTERDGWRHLYRISKDGSVQQPITKGNFDIEKVLKTDRKGGFVYYIASPGSAIDRYLYRSRIDGKGEAERITPGGMDGHHDYIISDNARYAIHIYSDSETPFTYEIVSLPNHKAIRTLEDNAGLKSRLSGLDVSPKEFFKVETPGAVLDAWMIKPAGFDPGKKYPVIFYIYGEPWSTTVQNRWGGNNDMWSRFLSQQGYIVMSVDVRGANLPRGREWRKCVYGKVGIIPPADHAEAVKKIISMYPYVDRSRIGIWGWSGGGSSTAHLMFKYPDIYSVGIAVAGVYSQYLYDTIYQERYMGLPSTNPEGYHDGSPVNFAGGLEGELLLIHGTGDDNVHYQSCEMLVNELIKQNKMFHMLSYPMRTHSISERENTSRHLYQSMFKFWKEHLPAGGR